MIGPLNIVVPSGWYSSSTGWNVEMVGPLIDDFGQDLPMGSKKFKTILGHYDDTAQTRVRGALFGEVVPQATTDQRWLIRNVLVTEPIYQAYQSGQLSNLMVVSDEQADQLLPEPEDYEHY